MKTDLLLIGGGGHCRACIDVIEREGIYCIYGIIDEKLFKEGVRELLGYSILGGYELLESLRSRLENVFISIGQIKSPQSRIENYERLRKLEFKFPSIISPLAHLAKNVKVGQGSIIMHHALVNTNAQIGNFCIINTKALVEHDSIVGNFCHLSTASVVNGTCEIGENTFLGSNMILAHNTKIPKNSILYCNPLEKSLKFSNS